MFTYDLQIQNGHLLFDAGNGLVIIDTGSPSSFHEDGQISFSGSNYPVDTSYIVTAQYLSERLGVEIKGLLGMDIISHNPILIDVPNKKLVAGAEMQVENIGAGNFMGAIMINLNISGVPTRLLLDTGAWISYLDPSLTSNHDVIRTEMDFSPVTGINSEFTTPIYRVNTIIGGNEEQLEYGNLPTMLNMAISLTGAKGIIGYELLSRKAVYINGDIVGLV